MKRDPLERSQARALDESQYAQGSDWGRHICRVQHARAEQARVPRSGRGILLALGDSWFNYFPPFDALVVLQRKYGWQVQSVAVPGTRLSELAPPPDWKPAAAGAVPPASTGKQLDELLRIAQGLSQADKDAVQAILISGGGNDIVDKADFLPLLNPAGSELPAINAAAFSQRVDLELRSTLLQVLGAATALAEQALGRTVPILIHGYDHPVPDGRSFVPSESLQALFAKRGHTDLAANTAVMATMIDRLNQMQKALLNSHRKTLAHVTHVDLRGTLCGQAGADYRTDWQNEMHPTIPAGFTKVGDAQQAAL